MRSIRVLPRAAIAANLALVPTRGLGIKRDKTRGVLAGSKRIDGVRFGSAVGGGGKGLAVDLMQIADLKNDGHVNATDLGLLRGSWGGSGAADLDDEGVVGAADLGIRLRDWGRLGTMTFT